MASATEPDPFAHTRMSLGEHLEELRSRLFRSVVALVLAFIAAWTFQDPLTHWALGPMRQALAHIRSDRIEAFESRLAADPSLPRSTYFQSEDPERADPRPELVSDLMPIATGFTEGFWFALKLSLIGACFAAGPLVLWQLWGFIAAGLYSHERSAVLRFFPASLALFLGGAAFGYFLLLPWAFYFMAQVLPKGVAFLPGIGPYLSLLVTMTLSLGLAFQLPLVIHVLVRMDLVQRATLRRYRPHFAVAIFFLAAILTPSPDLYSQLGLALPMLLLFELGLLSTYLPGRSLRRRDAAPSGGAEARP
jgi:sec-independent protein translocase protein TatC